MFTRSVLCAFALCSAVHAEPIEILERSVDYLPDTDEWCLRLVTDRPIHMPEEIVVFFLGDMNGAKHIVGDFGVVASRSTESNVTVFSHGVVGPLRAEFLGTAPYTVTGAMFETLVDGDMLPYGATERFPFVAGVQSATKGVYATDNIQGRANVPEPSALALASIALLWLVKHLVRSQRLAVAASRQT